MSTLTLDNLDELLSLDENELRHIHGGNKEAVVKGAFGAAGVALVGASYAAGYGLGKAVDKGFGVSDWVSDKAIEILGPAPDWLQDMF